MTFIHVVTGGALLCAGAFFLEAWRTDRGRKGALRMGMALALSGAGFLWEVVEFAAQLAGDFDPGSLLWAVVAAIGALGMGGSRRARWWGLVAFLAALSGVVGAAWEWAPVVVVSGALAFGGVRWTVPGSGRASLVACLAVIGIGALPGAMLERTSLLSSWGGEAGLFWQIVCVLPAVAAAWLLAEGWCTHVRARTKAVDTDWRGGDESGHLFGRIILLASVAGAALLLMVLSIRTENAHAEDLKRSASLVATSLDPGDVQFLVPDDGDESPGARLRVLRALQSALQRIPNSHDIYVAAVRRGELCYLVGALKDPKEAVRPGEKVESEDLVLWHRVLRDGRSVFSPPSADKWGSWVTAFAAITRDSPEVIAVLGVDIESSLWSRSLARASIGDHAAYLAIVCVVMVAYVGGARARAARSEIEVVKTRLELALEGSGIITWEARTPGLHFRLGGRVHDGLGRVPRSFSLAQLLRRVHPADRARLRFSRRRTDGEAFEMRVLDDSGAWRWMLVKGREVARNPGTGERLFSGTALDVDAARRASEQARRLALVAQHTDNAVVMTDPGGLVEWLNEGFTRVTGYTLEEARGRKPGSFLQGPGTDREEVRRIGLAVRAGEPFTSTLRNYRKDGVAYDIHIEGRPLIDPQTGALSGYMAIERDVTRELSLEAALKMQRARLEKINRCLAGLGDDFRENLERLAHLLGELFGADCALYSRLEGDSLVVRGGYRMPADLPASDLAEGHICHQVILSETGRLQVSGLQHTQFAETDPNVRRYSLDTYIGRAVHSDRGAVGSLCVLFTTTFVPDEGLEVCLDLIAQAVGREEVLEASRRRLRDSLFEVELEKSRQDTLLRQLEGAVVFEDLEGRVVLANNAARRMLGPDIIAGADCARLASLAAQLFVDSSGFEPRIRRIVEDRLPVTEDLELRDGRILRRSYSSIHTESGACEGHLWHYQDVTAERRASRIFEAVAEVGSALVASSLGGSDWVMILERIGRAVGADRAYVFRHFLPDGAQEWHVSQLAEWNSGAADPQIDNPLFQNLPFVSAGFGRWDRLLKEGRAIVGTLEECPPEEHPLLVAQQIRSLLIVPIAVSGSQWGFVGFDACSGPRRWTEAETGLLHSVATTIGLRIAEIERESALRRARDEAEAANRAKSTFLATMSHEIRTPLNAVIGVASLFEEMDLREQQQDYVRTILSSSQALLDLINNILDYSKIESGKVELEYAPFNLSVVCGQVCDILRNAAHRKGVELVSRVQPGMPDSFVGDASRMRQIMLNLVGNAIKFTETGNVTLELGVDGSGAMAGPGVPLVIIRVVDTGVGISEEVRQRLFQPFVQGDSSTTRRYGGTGLGLVITRRLVELMGGTIGLQSKEGEGTTVVLRIPMRLSQQAIAGPGARLSPDLRVLVVDDLQINRVVLREWFLSWGAHCRLAAGVDEAMDVLSAHAFDVVLSDYHMPGRDGADLARAVRERFGAGAPTLILMSSDSTVPSEVRVLFDAVTLKPLWPVPLRELVAGIQRRSPAESPGTGSSSPFPTVPLRVLVAEDNVNNQMVVRFMLERKGIKPVIVSNGIDAVAAVEREAFDVVLMDMQMPGMDGLAAARTICEMMPDPNRRPFLVAFTANAFQDERDQAKRAGMEHYLVKPVTSGQLGELLEMATKRRSAKKRAREGLGE